MGRDGFIGRLRLKADRARRRFVVEPEIGGGVRILEAKRGRDAGPKAVFRSCRSGARHRELAMPCLASSAHRPLKDPARQD